MALEYKTGTKVVYTLQPTANSGDPFLVRITGASYGNNTTDVVVADDSLSITIEVVSATNKLVVTVASPNEIDEAAFLDGTDLITTFVLSESSSIRKLEITGTP